MKPNLKKKIFLILIIFIIFMAIIFNLHKIRFALGLYNIYNQEKNQDPISDEVNPNTIPLDNPLETFVVDLDNETINEDNKDTEDSIDTPQNTKASGNIRSYESIMVEYNSQLEALRSSFQSDLDNLVARGISDYSDSDLSNNQLASKYLNAGSDMERSSDKKFNSLVRQMEKDLKANGYNTNVIGEIREYYNSVKEAKKHDVISRGMNHL